jgi:hypothetical protein
VSADLEVKYASTKRSFSGLSLALTDGDGTTTYPYTGTGTCTNSTTSALCQGTTTPATFDQHFALPGGSNPTLSGLNSLTATFSADPVNNNGDTNDFASIDGAILTVTYTPLPFRAQNGCVTLGAGCGGSAATFFSATGSNSNVSFAGTVYAWDGSIDFNLPNEIGVAFQRGGVARTFALHAPASGAVQKVISLPPAQTITIPGLPGTTVSTDRKLTLTAVVTGSSGSGVITAVVDIDPAGKVTILSWNGKPCGSSGCA